MIGVTRNSWKRQKWVYNQSLSWHLQLTTGIVDACVPSSEGMVVKRHRALLAVGDVESLMYLSR